MGEHEKEEIGFTDADLAAMLEARGKAQVAQAPSVDAAELERRAEAPEGAELERQNALLLAAAMAAPPAGAPGRQVSGSLAAQAPAPAPQPPAPDLSTLTDEELAQEIDARAAERAQADRAMSLARAAYLEGRAKSGPQPPAGLRTVPEIDRAEARCLRARVACELAYDESLRRPPSAAFAMRRAVGVTSK